MKISYDPDVDAAYLSFKRGRTQVTTVRLTEDHDSCKTVRAELVEARTSLLTLRQAQGERGGLHDSCEDIVVDFGPREEVVGIEILDASKHLGLRRRQPEIEIENLKARVA